MAVQIEVAQLDLLVGHWLPVLQARQAPSPSQNLPPWSVHAVLIGAGVSAQQPPVHSFVLHSVGWAGQSLAMVHDVHAPASEPASSPAVPPAPPDDDALVLVLVLVEVPPPLPGSGGYSMGALLHAAPRPTENATSSVGTVVRKKMESMTLPVSPTSPRAASHDGPLEPAPRWAKSS